MDYLKESLRLHEEWKGKIEVIATVPVDSREALSLAYTPGVAQPCLEIQKDIDKSYDLTRRHNLCAVITDGTAVLGLGLIKCLNVVVVFILFYGSFLFFLLALNNLSNRSSNACLIPFLPSTVLSKSVIPIKSFNPLLIK